MTASRTDTWMPLYIGDYLRDTMGLTTEQHGAYLLLIMSSWTAGGSLPDDDEELAAITRLSPRAWQAARKKLAKFFQVDDNGWTQQRVLTELSSAKKLTEAKVRAGQKGARRRWQNDRTAMADGMPDNMATASQNDAPSPSPNSVPDGTGTTAAVPDDPLALPLPMVALATDDPKAALFRHGMAWLASQTGKPPNALRSLLGRWLKLSGDDSRAVYNLLADAQAKRIADPVSWVTAALSAVTPNDRAITKAMRCQVGSARSLAPSPVSAATSSSTRFRTGASSFSSTFSGAAAEPMSVRTDSISCSSSSSPG